MLGITLVHFDSTVQTAHDRGSGYISHGIISISGQLRFHGIEHNLVHLPAGGTAADCAGEIIHPIVGMSYLENSKLHAKEFARDLKRRFPDKVLISGGTHATLNSEEAIGFPGVDGICIGEGDVSLVNLIKEYSAGRPLHEIDDFWWKKDGEILKRGMGRYVEDLNQTPLPNYDIYDFSKLKCCNVRIKYLPVMTARGCPYNCSYCCNLASHKVYGRGRVQRLMTVDRVIAMIRPVLERRPEILSIAFDDDVFGANPEWLREFVEKYPRLIGLPFSCYARIDMASERYLKMLKKAGCFRMRIGLEAGDQRLRTLVLNKRFSNAAIRERLKLINSLGIEAKTSNMTGLPSEDLRQALKTVKVNAENQVFAPTIAAFYPYPHTELHDICQREGLIGEGQIDNINLDTILNIPGYPQNAIRNLVHSFIIWVNLYRGLYRRRLPKPLIAALDWIFLAVNRFFPNKLFGPLARKISSRLYDKEFRRVESGYRWLGRRDN